MSLWSREQPPLVPVCRPEPCSVCGVAPRSCFLCVWGPVRPPHLVPLRSPRVASACQPSSLKPGLGAFLAPLPPSGSYQPEPPAPMCPWQAHVQGQGSRVPPLWAPTDGAPFGGGWGGAVLEACRALA